MNTLWAIFGNKYLKFFLQFVKTLRLLSAWPSNKIGPAFVYDVHVLRRWPHIYCHLPSQILPIRETSFYWGHRLTTKCLTLVVTSRLLESWLYLKTTKHSHMFNDFLVSGFITFPVCLYTWFPNRYPYAEPFNWTFHQPSAYITWSKFSYNIIITYVISENETVQQYSLNSPDNRL